jgi:hypothetical protein
VYGEVTYDGTIATDAVSCNGSSCSAKINYTLGGAFGAKGEITVLWWEYEFNHEFYAVKANNTDTITLW